MAHERHANNSGGSSAEFYREQAAAFTGLLLLPQRALGLQVTRLLPIDHCQSVRGREGQVLTCIGKTNISKMRAGHFIVTIVQATHSSLPGISSI